MSTPFERGKAAGQWTEKEIKKCGFSSAKECLDHEEQVYKEDVAALADLREKDPRAVARQAEYLEGAITGARESLRKRR